MAKCITLREQEDIDLNITELFAMRQYWHSEEVFTTHRPKQDHSFLLFCGGCGEYTFPNGETMTAVRGDMVFIPRGAVYRTRFFDCDPGKTVTVLINFHMSQADGTELTFSDTVRVLQEIAPQSPAEALFFEIADLYERPVHAMTELKARFYQLLCSLERANRESFSLGRFSVIQAGIDYLENDSTQSLSIVALAAQCGVSVTHFRRLFKAYSGLSPMEFRLRGRILLAKKLLASGTMNVSEVSEQLGFNDVAYFSRQFHKYTGVSPSQYGKGHPFG